MRDYTRIYIDGAWSSRSAERLSTQLILLLSVPPARLRFVRQPMLIVRRGGPKSVQQFSCSSRQERIDLMSSILGVYVKRQVDLADVLTEELGAPLGTCKTERKRFTEGLVRRDIRQK
jgi:aldehyde dehydrogenase (NAD+)